MTLEAALAERHAQLKREQLVELQPVDRGPALSVVLGKVDPAQGRILVCQVLARQDVGWKRLGDGRQPLERAVDELANRPWRDALRRAGDRDDPAGGHGVGLLSA